MKALTENRIKNVAGFIRNPRYDFSDDGNRFTGWEYKGLPLTQCRDSHYGETYLSIRVDYLNENTKLPAYFTYQERKETSWYPLCDKYNGVSELPELEEIVADLETIIAGIKELNAKVQAEEIDAEPIEKQLLKEKEYVQNGLEEFKAKFDFFNFNGSNYELNRIRDYVKSLNRYIQQIEEILVHLNSDEPFSRRELKEYAERANDYIICKVGDNFYLEELNEIISK